MAPRTKLEDKLEGIENFLAWKYRIGLIIQENYLDKYIKEEVVELEECATQCPNHIILMLLLMRRIYFKIV